MARFDYMARGTRLESEEAAYPNGGQTRRGRAMYPDGIGRCTSRYPGAVTLRGRAVRCELRAGHDGQHGHSFAARYWDWDDAHATVRTTRDGE